MVEQHPGNPEQDIQQQGLAILEAVELSHLADMPITTSQGTILIKDILSVCGDGARAAFIGFQLMDTQSPAYEAAKKGIRNHVLQRAGLTAETHGG